MKHLYYSVVAIALFAAACASEETGNTDPEPAGSELFTQPHADGNSFACITCHAMQEPAPDGFIRPGHPVGDAAARPNFKNGRVATLLEAVNSCRVEWMAATPLSSTDERWLELEAYLQAEAPESAPALSFEIVAPPSDVSGGDAERGREVFNNTCIVCHGEDAAGSVRAPKLAGLEIDPDYIARRVRTSGLSDSDIYDGLTGGRMPFWAADRLSDQELIDVVAYVNGSEPPPEPDAGMPDDMTPDAGMPDDMTPDAGTDEACGSTHPRVGQVAELSTLFHGVSGTATIVDDCTIEIQQFNFDGEGVDVRVYGALGENYQNGFSMSDDLRRSGGYSNEALTVKIPETHSLDDLDGLSIWCVPVGASFGDGLFR